MATTDQIQPGNSEKLLIEYPFKEALQIYLGRWKQILKVSGINLVGIGALIIISQFITVGVFLGAISSAATSVIIFLIKLVTNNFSYLFWVAIFIAVVLVIVRLLNTGKKTAA